MVQAYRQSHDLHTLAPMPRPPAADLARIRLAIAVNQVAATFVKQTPRPALRARAGHGQGWCLRRILFGSSVVAALQAYHCFWGLTGKSYARKSRILRIT